MSQVQIYSHITVTLASASHGHRAIASLILKIVCPNAASKLLNTYWLCEIHNVQKAIFESLDSFKIKLKVRTGPTLGHFGSFDFLLNTVAHVLICSSRSWHEYLYNVSALCIEFQDPYFDISRSFVFSIVRHVECKTENSFE